MPVREIEEHDVVETLDAVDALYATRCDADASMFVLAAHFADLHSGDALPRSRTVLPGMERGVQVGGAGTPRVAEFAYAELGARMRMGTWSAKRYVADALDVRHRLPLIWARVQAREARIGNARLVASKTRHLSVEAAAYVDRAMVDFVDGSLPWGRFEARLDGKVVAADPAVAAAREAERTAQQFAKRTRSSEEGTAGFYVRSTVGVIARIEATVTYVAEALRALGDSDDLDQRRVKAVVLLCNPTKATELLAAFTALRSSNLAAELAEEDPGLAFEEPAEVIEEPDDEPPDALGRMESFARRVGVRPTHLPDWLAVRSGVDPEHRPAFGFDWSALLPSVTLYLHLSAEDLSRGRGGVVRWEGEGPVTHQYVHEHLRPLHRYVIQPVVDLAGQAPVDAYEIPDRHRQAVHLRTPADTFPFSSDLTRKVDIDHNEAYDAAHAGGPEQDWASRLGNYGPLGRFHHRIKTHGHWTVRQPFHGIYLWRDPHGQVYLVDHTGTHKVTPAGHAAGLARTFDRDLQLYSGDDVVVHADFGVTR